MTVKLNKTSKTIHVCEMRDGQIAEIITWGLHTHYVGRVVQRWGKHLIAIGGGYGSGWCDIFCGHMNQEDLMVRILEPNETLTICDNG